MTLNGKQFEGQPGNRDHITMRQEGTIPTDWVRDAPGVKGERPGEHRNRHGEDWDSFVGDIKERGIQRPIFVTVDYNDVPRISEGNHRRDAAVEAGLPEVPAEVRYFGRAESQGTIEERSRRR